MSLLSNVTLAIPVLLLTITSTASANDHLELVRYTIDGGGIMQSAGGDFVLSGTIGQPDASTPQTGGDFTVIGGLWNANLNLANSNFAAWAATNIGPELDSSFEGDANRDGFANGLVYVFGIEGLQLFGPGILTAPPAIVPGDIMLVLEASDDLITWTPILIYTSGVQTLRDPTINIADGKVTATDAGPRGFYRYRVELLQ